MTTHASSKAIPIPLKAKADKAGDAGSGLVIKVELNNKQGISSHALVRALALASTAKAPRSPRSPGSDVEFEVGSFSDKVLPRSFVEYVLHAKAKSPKSQPTAASVQAPPPVVRKNGK